MSALFAAGRHQELLSLLDTARHKWWSDRRWGVKALVAMDRPVEALQYAESFRRLNEPLWDIARACEEILLSVGRVDEAYSQIAIEANQGTTNLATFRAIAKKYPSKLAGTILRDLVAPQPGEAAKWFAVVKDVGLFDLAIELANQSPTDPRTLIRATKDFAQERSSFAVAAG